MNELALFAGAGGGILGGLLCGFRTVCAVEINPYAASVLVERQNQGILPPFPVWDDVRTFDGKPWRGLIDVVSGGFPCQDISAAGRGAGIKGARSGLWREMARVVREVRPGFVLVENSPMLTRRGLGIVLADLAEIGYDAEWDVLGACDVGACHYRRRLWICAYRADERGNWPWPTWEWKSQLPDVVSREQHRTQVANTRGNYDAVAGRLGHAWRSIGNGQVPAVVRKAWHVLCQRAAAEHCERFRNSKQQPQAKTGEVGCGR